MDDMICISADDIEIIDVSDYTFDVDGYYSSVPEVAKPLLKGAKVTLSKIEKMLSSTPGFINAVKASIPDETLQAILSDEQKSQIAQGAVKLMTKKDGSLMANLVNPKIGRAHV